MLIKIKKAMEKYRNEILPIKNVNLNAKGAELC